MLAACFVLKTIRHRRMNKLQNGVYGMTDKAAWAAQRMGWSAAYLTALWVGSALVGACARKFFRRGL
jgi:hypothetical protein